MAEIGRVESGRECGVAKHACFYDVERGHNKCFCLCIFCCGSVGQKIRGSAGCWITKADSNIENIVIIWKVISTVLLI